MVRSLIIILRLFHPGAEQYAPFIEASAKQFRFDPLLVAAVIFVESKFEVRACGSGSHGLMQIQLKGRSCKATVTEAERLNLYDPETNIYEGVRIMAMWRRYGKHKPYHWLLHYNQGYGKCVVEPCETKERVPILVGRRGEYSKKVIAVYNKLKRIARGQRGPPKSR